MEERALRPPSEEGEREGVRRHERWLDDCKLTVDLCSTTCNLKAKNCNRIARQLRLN